MPRSPSRPASRTARRACPFCSIEKTEPSAVVFRNAHALVVLDKHPLVNGHLLAIPRRHAESLADLKPAEILALIQAAARAQNVLLRFGFGTGVDWRVNYRPFLAESEYTVRHAHVHLLPRTKDDALFRVVYKNQYVLRTHPTVAERAKAGARFRKAFAQLLPRVRRAKIKE